MLSANRGNWTSLLPVWIFSIFLLLYSSKTPNTKFNINEESGHFLPLSIILVVGLSKSLYYVEVYYSIPNFIRDFYHECMPDFISGFSEFIDMIM